MTMTRRDHQIMQGTLILLASSLFWAQSLHNGLGGDVFWQWAAGRYMIHHHLVLHDDVFSYTLYHKPWVTEEWGYEVLLAALVSGLGGVAFWLMSAGIGTILMVSLAWLLSLRGVKGLKNGLLVLMAAPGLVEFVKDRPQAFSYVFFVWMLIILWNAKTHPRRLWWSVPLLWVWTNMHGSFLLGFLLLLLEGIWIIVPVNTARVKTWPTQVSLKHWARVFSVSVLASFMNPNGPGLWAYSWHVSFSTRIAEYIAEWQSPDFHMMIWVVVILVPLFLLVLLMLFGNIPVNWPDFFLVAGLFYATMKSIRFLPYYDVQWAVLLGVLTREWPFRRIQGYVVAPVLLVLTGLILFEKPIVPAGKPVGEPILAAQYLKTHPGRVFNMYHWGGYLISQHIPVFIDGRTDFYLQGHQLHQYMAVKNLTENPNIIWKQYNVHYVLWQPKTAVSTYLLSLPKQWTPIIKTKTAILFQHRGLW
ncbi:hypothetical protein [Sulfobacillus thermosulfidooxidans]|uniref:hypothetical protein n=1 Tax=Sulfobacillus thermosulfidooxidans TaxID=28034 RepID=UPI000417EA19|nr:hypothetical protein [Sulfobacillus thermosulfidooxidans]